jgi:hypothetical protein
VEFWCLNIGAEWFVIEGIVKEINGLYDTVTMKNAMTNVVIFAHDVETT